MTSTTLTSLSFLAFRLTGREVQDLRKELPGFFSPDDHPDAVPGRLYADDLFIEAGTRSGDGTVIWTVEVGPSPRQGDLRFCEAELYGFYASERIHDLDVRAFLVDEAPESHYFGEKPADSMETMSAIYAGFEKTHGYSLGSADEMILSGEDNHGRKFLPEHIVWLQRFCSRWEEWECNEGAQPCPASSSDTTGLAPLAPFGKASSADSKLLKWPVREPGYTVEEWTLVLKGWDMYAAALRASVSK